MKKLINKKDISPSCSYCQNGRTAPNGENVLCKKMGVVEKNFACKKFIYDPLKRQPKRPVKSMDFDKDDFSL